MRILMFLWISPMAFMAAWYGLSAHDINFGTVFFSRQMHDLVFGIYANVLGVEPEVLPGMLAKTLAFDLFLIACIFAYRRRKQIMNLYRSLSARWQVESLST